MFLKTLSIYTATSQGPGIHSVSGYFLFIFFREKFEHLTFHRVQ